ncbi:ATP synthase subunit b [Rubripirellula lacrimiformis]|uniref:ATP synthase subunit b n=1 Tax=Rubripirellula lacrimiformis TaxID=1930273 RepID=A0A517NIQ2_9BACT|nr:F0F1 ATP synthase subunit delta [Rubripirellula lacrimiformis]QDT06968.1 ATP synthase subunit b [Rubripirellula lacrimiformis]
MLIDWFTVGAQTINFLVLVWLLKRFLYKPILDAIEERENRIASELAYADKQKQEAKQERDEFTKKNEEFDQQRSALLSEATEDVKAKRLRLLDEARIEADGLRAKRQESLKRELASLRSEITRRTQAEVFAIARHALTDLADADLESRMCEVFLARLRSVDDDVKQTVRQCKLSDSDPAVVRTALQLSAPQHDAIEDTIHEVFSSEMPVRFETDAEIASGIELTLGGQRIAWSIGDYLTSLQNSVDQLLDDDSPQADNVQASVVQ